MKSKEWLVGFILGCTILVSSVFGLLYFNTPWWLAGFLCGALLLYSRVTRWLSISSVSTVRGAPVDAVLMSKIGQNAENASHQCALISDARFTGNSFGVMPDIHSGVRIGVCRELAERLTLNDTRVQLRRGDAVLLKVLLDGGFLSEKDCREAVHKGLVQCGVQMFVYLQRCSWAYPDHVLSPQALGYAILHEGVTAEQVATIRFDHGETSEQYCENARTLLDTVMEQLRAGPGPEPTFVPQDTSMCCDGSCH